LTIAPSRRGGDVFAQFGPAMDAHQRHLGIQMVFGAFEPHLVSLYCTLQRPYADRNINTPDAGYLIPMLSFLDGPAALRGHLDGALEVSDDGRRIAVLHAGDVFGETAFLLLCPRTYDVDVLHDGTRLLAVSERTLRCLEKQSPATGAKFFANLARVVSSRLVS